jgi:predicted nucleotidyltransferase
MNCSISSKNFDHPLLKPILNDLTEYFSSINIKFFVIGATARDIMLSIHGEKARRATHDLDIAISN